MNSLRNHQKKPNENSSGGHGNGLNRASHPSRREKMGKKGGSSLHLVVTPHGDVRAKQRTGRWDIEIDGGVEA